VIYTFFTRILRGSFCLAAGVCQFQPKPLPYFAGSVVQFDENTGFGFENRKKWLTIRAS
jgi:hypothetical protein